MPNRLRELRIAHGMTQCDLAAEFDVDQSTISSWERGTRRIPVDLIPVFAAKFAASPSHLMRWDTIADKEAVA